MKNCIKFTDLCKETQKKGKSRGQGGKWIIYRQGVGEKKGKNGEGKDAHTSIGF